MAGEMSKRYNLLAGHELRVTDLSYPCACFMINSLYNAYSKTRGVTLQLLFSEYHADIQC
jgi:hypothetical protein